MSEKRHNSQKILKTGGICGAKTLKGTECQEMPIEGSNRCRIHGGLSRTGPLSGTWKTGVKSKYNPSTELSKKYKAALDDPGFLSQRNEIALMDARIQTLVERLEDDQNIPTWMALSKTWDKFLLAIRTGNEREQTELVQRLDAMIQKATEHIDLWDDIQKTIDHRRKLTDAEQKHLLAHQSMMTIDQVMMIMNTTFMALRDIVTKYADKDTAKHIVIEAASYHRSLISPDGSGKNS